VLRAGIFPGQPMPKSRAWGLAATGTLLSLTGSAMIAFRYVLPTQDAFSAYPHWLWPRLLLVHVFAAPVFFFYVGSVWWTHVSKNWRIRKRRVSGGVLVGVAALMGISGYALYFLGSEVWLGFTRLLHAVAGAVCAVLYVTHAAMGWASLRRADRLR